MSILLYMAGLLIGLVLFLYILSLYNSGKEKIQIVTGKRQPRPKPRADLPAGSLSFASIPPGERMCPLCRSKLTKYEALYASRMKTSDGDKIFIHGCRYCYKPDEDPDQARKSTLP